MTVIALTNFLDVTDSQGRVQLRFQNSKPGETITYKGNKYPYLPFAYQGMSKNRSGDNIEAAIILSANEISMGYAARAVQKKWNIKVSSCSMHPVNFTVGRTLATEYWLAASMSYDVEAVEILLSSSVDAVGATAPTRTLTRSMVGALPTSGQVQNR